MYNLNFLITYFATYGPFCSFAFAKLMRLLEYYDYLYTINNM